MSKPTITDARAKHLQEYLDEHGITVKNKVHDKPDNFIHAIILWLGALFVANFNVLYATRWARRFTCNKASPRT